MRFIRIPQLKVLVTVGTPEDLQAGRGKVAVSAEQAREFLGLSDGGFRLLVARGELAPVAKYGKGLLYLADDVEALLAGRK